MIFGFFRKKNKDKPQEPAQQKPAEPKVVSDGVADAADNRPPEDLSAQNNDVATPAIPTRDVAPDGDVARDDRLPEAATTELVGDDASPAAEHAATSDPVATENNEATANTVMVAPSSDRLPEAHAADLVRHNDDDKAAANSAQTVATNPDDADSAPQADLPVAVPAANATTEQAETETHDDTLADDASQTLAENRTELPADDNIQTDAAEHGTLASSNENESVHPAEPAKLGWAARLKQGLTKSRDQMAKSLASVFGGGKIDEDLYEELETVLLTADTGIEATEKLLKSVRDRVSLKGLKDGAELKGALKDALYELIAPLESPLVLPPKASGSPFVIMLAGINGAGKTTSIGKLAKYFQAQGYSVLLAAGDTFRAAAREQLQEWGKRNDVTVISQASGDSAAVCFDAVEAAKARGIDIVLADTAGRLPAQLHLMEEIKKVKRVLQKAMPDAPHEIILVLDANIGQNALRQVAAFNEALGLTGLILTKLDGTAKGGVLAALAEKHPVPVRYIGVGEGIDDLRPFKAREFVDALLDD